MSEIVVVVVSFSFTHSMCVFLSYLSIDLDVFSTLFSFDTFATLGLHSFNLTLVYTLFFVFVPLFFVHSTENKSTAIILFGGAVVKTIKIINCLINFSSIFNWIIAVSGNKLLT